jgi:hypothetical protein
VFAAVAAVIIGRSGVFVFYQQAFFDSNQAVIGLMAKHLSEGRAFPVFMYGQNYMLGVEAWLAAPLFMLAGPSVQALKLPLLAINLTIALLLLWLLRREARLSPSRAALASVFFVMSPPGTAARLLEASGGIVEPLVYVLILWLVRFRPVLFGLVLGFGFIHREFTVYGFMALLVLEAAHGTLLTRERLKGLAVALSVATAVWLVVQGANRHASAMGPGTTLTDLNERGNQLAQLGSRICLEWTALPVGLWRIVTIHWPLLFGTSIEPVRAFDVESNVIQGFHGLGAILGAAMIIAVARMAAQLVKERRWHSEYDFCAYLVAVGALSAAGYAIARCGVIDLPRMRYDMLSIHGAVGLAGCYLAVERSTAWLRVWVALVIAWAAVSAAAHGRLWLEYLHNPPQGGKEQIISELDARQIRYAISQYRDAYVIDFLTNERIIVASDRVRIERYQREVDEHRREAIRIKRTPCVGGERVMPRIYFCPLTRPDTFFKPAKSSVNADSSITRDTLRWR